MSASINLGVRVRTLDRKWATVDSASDMDPTPLVWPVCERCDTAYVLRLVYSLSRGQMWAWTRDCAKPRSTCKGAGAVLHDADGEVPPDGR